MRKRYTKRGSVGKASRKERRKTQTGKGRTVQLMLDPEELVTMMQDSLTSFATEMGLKVATLLLKDEVNQRCGSRYERVAGRAVTRYGHQRGVAVIAGQKLPIPRPRMRYTRQCGKVDLETYARLQSPDTMPQSVLKRLVEAFPAETTRAWWTWPVRALGCRSRASAARSSKRRPTRCDSCPSDVSTACGFRWSISMAYSTLAKR